MGKITVKHYLNTRVSPLVLGSEGNEKDYYPIYTQITHDRRTTQIRSFTNYYFTVAGIEDYIKTGKFDDDDFFSVSKFDNKALADEITQIEKSIYFITYNKLT